MAEKRIEKLREILAKAAARDEELEHALQAIVSDLMKELRGDDKLPVWAELKATKGERQVNEYFVMKDRWLRGDLMVEVTPEKTVVLNLRMQTTRDSTHEVGLADAPSKSLVIDPPDDKHREEARKKFFDNVFAHLEGEIRQSVDFPSE